MSISKWRILKDLNTLGLRQNGSCFGDDFSKKLIFLDENCCVSIKFLLKFVSKGAINDMPALGQIMVWRQTGNKPLSESMIA